MKKRVFIIALLLGITFTFVFSGCSSKKEESSDNNPTQAAEAQESSTKDAEDKSGDGELEGLISGKTDPDNFSFEYAFKGEDGKEASMKVWVKGKKERMEMGEGDQLISTYIDGEKGESYVYLKSLGSAIKGESDSNSSFESPATFMSSMDKEQLKMYKKAGSETIDGNKCIKYEYKLTEKNDDFIIYIMESSGLIVKYEYLQDGKLFSSMYYKNFKIGGVTDEMVTLPKDIPITQPGN